MNADIINKVTGKTVTTSTSNIVVTEPSVVRIDLQRAQVSALQRDGNDLIVRLADGETIRITNYYAPHKGAPNDLVLREGDQSLWLANSATPGTARFSALNTIDELIAATESSGGGGGALLPALLGVAGAGGLVAGLAGGGGGGGGGGRPGASTDTTAPAAPVAAVNGTGTGVTGTGEAGATIQVRDAAGAIIGTGTVDGAGNYSVTLAQPQANGQTVTVTQSDTAGNVSPPTRAVAPDITAPGVPVAAINASGTVVSGTGEAGATVTIRNAGGAVVGTGVVDAQGNYAITLATPQIDGGRLAVTQADPAGNVSSAAFVTTPDLMPPAAPTATISADGATLTGTGEPGAAVTVRDDGGTPVATGVVLPDGTYSLPLPPGTADGGTISVSQTDTSGNTSPATTVTTPDLAAPAAPTATVTSDGTAVTGTGEAGATVTVRDASGTPLGSAVVAADGSYSVSLAPAQANGETLNVSQADPAGNVSPAVTTTAPDITAPAAPAASVSADGMLVSGTGEAGATVTVRDPSGTVIGTGTVASGGTYSIMLSAAQVNGENLSVTQADAANNTSPATTATAPDLTAPMAPSGTVSADGMTLNGTGEPGAILTVRTAAGIAIGSATVAADGSFSAVLSPVQANGEILQIRQADAAGNLSPSVSVTAPDITAPLGLTAGINAAGTVVSGTGEPGAAVTVRDPLGTAIGTATVGDGGTYTVVLTTPQANGQLLQVTQADPAGNPSAPVPVTAPDITAPNAPTALVSSDGTTLTGTGEPGATVTVRDPGGSVIGIATVASNGGYSVPLTTAQTNGEVLIVRQSDAAGNVSPQVPATAPDITAPVGLTSSINGTGTVVTGTGEAGATVTVRDPLGVAIGTAVVAGNGAYAVVLTTPQVNGEILNVRQADAAGNPSSPVAVTAPDITAPAAPGLIISADGTTATGTGEAGATVTVTTATGTVLGSTVVGGNGGYTIILSTPQANGQIVTATQTDAANNVSPATSVTAPDITAPALPVAVIDATGAVVSGTGEAGATVVVRDPFATIIGTAVVDASGNFSVVLSVPQIDSQVLSVVQTDGAGNPSPAAPVIAPDLTAPAAPAGTVAADGASITGSGEAGAVLVITDPVGVPVGTVVVASDGSFTTALVPPQVNGEVLTLTQTDGAGNVSAPGSATAPDLVPNDSPGAPTAAVAPDGATVFGTGDVGATVRVSGANGATLGTGIVAPGGTYTVILTTPQINGETVRVVQIDAEGDVSPPATAVAPDLTPPAAPVAVIDAAGVVVSGTGEAGAIVRVTSGSTVLGTATVNANGGYAVTLATPQTNGQALVVTQADGAGNVSAPAAVTAPDITAPGAPTAVVSSDGAIVTGTGEAGATVRITGPAGTVLATAVVGTGGTYTATLSTPQINGERLTAVQVDPANNVSPSVSATAPDLIPPAAPSAIVGPSGLVVTGNGEAGATVTVRDASGTPIATATVAANGSYSATLPNAQLDGQRLSVIQADAAGNVSPATQAIAPDVTPPPAPTGTVSADGTTVSGLGEAGATVRITDAANTVIGSGLVAADGSYIVTLNAPQANGQALGAVQVDPSGNVSPATPLTAPDITPPAPPANVAVSAEGTVVTGTGEANAVAEVRNAGGTLLGTATVAANGSFAVSLSAAQTAGETLSVTLRDAAGNQSGAVPVIAPFDIAAFDNSATASVDLVPVTANRTLGNANYLALVSLGLLNLDAQVLGVPNVQFSVAAGHTLDATFSYDATLNIGVLSGYSVSIQRFDGTNWVAVNGQGNNSLLQLGLLNGNLVATETLGPGDYRAFVTFDGTLGVGLLGGLTATGVDRDFTDIASVVPGTTTGNVITDPGTGGAVDVASPQTVVSSVTINGVTTAVTADGTVVDGAWGTLTINRDGSYTYTPDATAAAIGKTDVFSYTLRDPTDGELETANLTVTIGSPDITGAPVAVNDSAVATATFQHVVTTTPAAVDSSFATPTALIITGAKTGSVTDSFTVDSNSTADVTLSAIRQGGLSVLPSYTITVSNAQGTVVGTITQTAVAGLPLGSGTSLTLRDLPSGTYSYTVSSTNLLGTGYGTNVYVGQTVTHLDQHQLSATTATEGDLFANDTLGTAFATVRIQSGGSFVEVGETPLTITGTYGTLTVNETGHYTYQPSAGLAYSGSDPVDSFAYQIVQPNGEIATARLDVAVDINNGVAPIVSSMEAPAMMSAFVEAVPMMTMVAEHDTAAAPGPAPGSAMLVLDLGGGGTVDQDLGLFLDARAEPAQTVVATQAEPLATDITAMSPQGDPLGYLVSPMDLENDRSMLLHTV